MDVMGSADASEHWAKSTMVLHVAGPDMAAMARGVDGVANKIGTWRLANADRLTFRSMGADLVSQSIARRVHDNAHAEPGGLLWALDLAVRNLRETAAALRAGSDAYWATERANAADFG